MMKIDSLRFGALEASPDQFIEFPAGLPGFENLHRFSLFYPEGQTDPATFLIMQSVDDPGVAFNVANPARFGFEYEFVLGDENCSLIGLANPVDAVVAVMLVKDVAAGLPMTAGLYAPLVINSRTRRAVQVFIPHEPPAPRRQIVSTAMAPAAIGPYSQAVRAGNTIYLSGQIGLDPLTMQMADGIDAQIVRVFDNLRAVAAAAGATLNDAVKFTIYLTDLANFVKVNDVMAEYVDEPYPARAAVGVRELPRGALVEADAILVVG
jgi:reactive intermediate/imine deaminase